MIPQFKSNLQKNHEVDNRNREDLLKVIFHEYNRCFNDDLINNGKNKASICLRKIPLLEGKNLEIYQEMKKLTRFGIYPNLYLKRSEVKGYGVYARDQIAEGTLITEYAGSVEYYYQVSDNSDDIFEIIETKNSRYNRVINPKEYCNLGRFINTSTKPSETNVKSIRMSNNDSVILLLYAYKKIMKNKELLYDYNGMHNNYTLK